MQAHCQAVPLPGLQMQATQNTLMFRAVEAAFSIKPLFDLAARQASHTAHQQSSSWRRNPILAVTRLCHSLFSSICTTGQCTTTQLCA